MLSWLMRTALSGRTPRPISAKLRLLLLTDTTVSCGEPDVESLDVHHFNESVGRLTSVWEWCSKIERCRCA